MSEGVLPLVGALLALAGSLFYLTAAVGLLRLPDFYARTHAAGIADTLGAGLILVGLMLQAGPTLIGVKLVFTLVFLLLTSPIACHALVKAAYSGGVKAEPDGGANAPAH